MGRRSVVGLLLLELVVYDYQGIPGNDVQVYYAEQATQNVAGGRAPCTDTTTHPEINGMVCRLP